MFARRLVPGPDKCRIAVAAPTVSAAGRAEALAELAQIGELLAGVRVKNNRAHWNLENDVLAGAAVTIRTFTVAAALAAKLAVVAVAKKRVVIRVRLEINRAAVSAVAAGWAASRDILLPAERHAAVSAVATLHRNLGFVNEHRTLDPRGCSKEAYATAEDKKRNG